MALPANVGTGYVTGTFMDTSGALASGTITFTASPVKILDPGATTPTTILPIPVTVALSGGTFLQALVATDDIDLFPTGFTYRVDFQLKSSAMSLSIPSFNINVPTGTSGQAADLTIVSPVPESDGGSTGGGFGDGFGDVAGDTHASPAKDTPIDTDELPLVDTAASNVLKRLTWASLKAALIATLTKSSVGLGNVDNTADAAKPVSAAQQAAIDGAVGNRIVFYNTSTSTWPARPSGSLPVTYKSELSVGALSPTDMVLGDDWDKRLS